MWKASFDEVLNRFELEEVDRCPLCLSNEGSQKWTRNSRINSWLCPACDLVYAEKRLAESEVPGFYQAYNVFQNLVDCQTTMDRYLMYSQDHSFVTSYFSHRLRANILDIGCGHGYFLSLFPQNYVKYGVEIDDKILRGRHQNITFVHTLEEVKNVNFDLIILRGTLPYIRDLRALKNFFDSNLNHGGFIAILTLPNKNSPLAEIQREEWKLYNPIERMNIFSLQSIENFFGGEDSEYAQLATTYPYLETPYANEKADLENFKKILQGENIKIPFWGSVINLIVQRF